MLVGGEESGGIGIPRHLPERDGMLNSLLLTNVMADERKPLGQIVADLQREFGPHYYGRRDLRIPDEVKYGAIRRAASPELTNSAATTSSAAADLDGMKFFLDAPTNGNGAEAWILLRASGTEPLMRLYCEAVTRSW